MATTNLLKLVPKPLRDDLAAGRWLPIIGAGLSRNADVDPGFPTPPDWAGLGDFIADQLSPGYAPSGPVETISAFEHAFGRNKLVEVVTQALTRGNPRPGAVHRAFCELPFDFVVTTNAEQILEAGYRDKHGAVLSVIEESQLRLKNPYTGPTVVKLHGDLHHPDSLVFTENDYDEFAIQRPLFVTWLATQLISKTGILIGYSLDDPDFRAITAHLRSRLGRSAPDLYSIEVGADESKIERFRRRGVRVINLPSTRRKYAILEDFFGELSTFWKTELGQRITSPNGAIRALLRAGRRTNGVVLFLVDTDRLSSYEEYVFPALLDNSMIPVSRNDVTDDSGSPVAVLDTLLTVADSVIVEPDAPNSPPVARLATAVGSDRVIQVTSSGSLTTDSVRAVALGDDWERFAASITGALQELQSSTFGTEDVLTTMRMLAGAGDYRAACLIGLVELEAALRRKLDVPVGARFRDRHFLGFRELLEMGRAQFNLDVPDPGAQRLVAMRNEMVHGQSNMPRDEQIVLYGVLLELLESLE